MYSRSHTWKNSCRTDLGNRGPKRAAAIAPSVRSQSGLRGWFSDGPWSQRFRFTGTLAAALVDSIVDGAIYHYYCPSSITKLCDQVEVGSKRPYGVTIHIQFGDVGTMCLNREIGSMIIFLNVCRPVMLLGHKGSALQTEMPHS